MARMLLLDGADVEVMGSRPAAVGCRTTDKVYVDMCSVAGHWASAAAGVIAQQDKKCPSYPACGHWEAPINMQMC